MADRLSRLQTAVLFDGIGAPDDVRRPLSRAVRHRKWTPVDANRGCWIGCSPARRACGEVRMMVNKCRPWLYPRRDRSGTACQPYKAGLQNQNRREGGLGMSRDSRSAGEGGGNCGG